MSHDENSSELEVIEEVDEDDSVGGLSTSFGSDEEGSQAIEDSQAEESDRDSSPPRRAPARRRGNAGGGGGRQGNARGRAGRDGVAAARRTAAPSRARTTTRGAGRGRSRRPVKGAAKFCGRCGRPVRDEDGHSHKGCGRTYFYKFSVSKS